MELSTAGCFDLLPVIVGIACCVTCIILGVRSRTVVPFVIAFVPIVVGVLGVAFFVPPRHVGTGAESELGLASALTQMFAVMLCTGGVTIVGGVVVLVSVVSAVRAKRPTRAREEA